MANKDIELKKGRKGTVFASGEAKTKDSPIRPVDLLESVFHGDTKALFSALSPRGKKVPKAASEKERTFSRGASGKVSMLEEAAKSKVK